MIRTLVLFALCAAAPALADGTIVYEITSAGHAPRQLTMLVGGQKVAVELKAEEPGGHSFTSLRDLSTKTTWLVDHTRKVVREITPEDAAAMKAALDQMRERMKERVANLPEEQRKHMESMMAGDDGKPVKVTFVKKGGHKTIAGYPCDEYLVKREGSPDIEACFIPHAKLGKWGEQTRETFKHLLDGSPAAGLAAQLAQWDWTQKFPGFPAQSTRTDPQGVVVTTTLKSLSKAAPPADAFALPKDYPVEKQPLPRLGPPGMPPH